MTAKQLVLLKVSELGISIAYVISWLWIYMMYLYGAAYYPINHSHIEDVIPFELFVIIISVAILGWITFGIKGNSFTSLVLQSIGLIVFSIPFYATVSAVLGVGIDETKHPTMWLIAVGGLTVLTVNINDWKKINKPSR